MSDLPEDDEAKAGTKPAVAEPAVELKQPLDAAPLQILEQAPSDDSAMLNELEHIVEALLLAADQPLSLDQLQRLLGEDLGIGRAELRSALALLDQRLTSGASELREVASGWRIQVREEYAGWVARLWQEKPPKFSRALLETLALVCYRQPITRGEIEEVRGVSVSSNILRTLQERGWVREIGVKEVPGRPALFGTTAQFLDDFNLRSLDQLPSLPEIRDMDQLDAALAQLAGELPDELVDGDESETALDDVEGESRHEAPEDDGDDVAPTEPTVH
jgi:segregation and condensation protein B